MTKEELVKEIIERGYTKEDIPTLINTYFKGRLKDKLLNLTFRYNEDLLYDLQTEYFSSIKPSLTNAPTEVKKSFNKVLTYLLTIATIVYYKDGEVLVKVIKDNPNIIDDDIQKFLEDEEPTEYMAFTKDLTMDKDVYDRNISDYKEYLINKYKHHDEEFFSNILKNIELAPDNVLDDFMQVVYYAAPTVRGLRVIRDTIKDVADKFGYSKVKNWITKKSNNRVTERPTDGTTNDRLNTYYVVYIDNTNSPVVKIEKTEATDKDNAEEKVIKYPTRCSDVKVFTEKHKLAANDYKSELTKKLKNN